MKDISINLSSMEVQEILRGHRTELYRQICHIFCGSKIHVGEYSPTIVNDDGEEEPGNPIFGAYCDFGCCGIKSPYGLPGSLILVKEKWGSGDCFYQDHENDTPGVIAYAADRSAIQFNAITPRKIPEWDIDQWNWSVVKWRSSMNMPLWASRLSLRVESISVQEFTSTAHWFIKFESIKRFKENTGRKSTTGART